MYACIHEHFFLGYLWYPVLPVKKPIFMLLFSTSLESLSLHAFTIKIYSSTNALGYSLAAPKSMRWSLSVYGSYRKLPQLGSVYMYLWNVSSQHYSPVFTRTFTHITTWNTCSALGTEVRCTSGTLGFLLFKTYIYHTFFVTIYHYNIKV